MALSKPASLASRPLVCRAGFGTGLQPLAGLTRKLCIPGLPPSLCRAGFGTGLQPLAGLTRKLCIPGLPPSLCRAGFGTGLQPLAGLTRKLCIPGLPPSLCRAGFGTGLQPLAGLTRKLCRHRLGVYRTHRNDLGSGGRRLRGPTRALLPSLLQGLSPPCQSCPSSLCTKLSLQRRWGSLTSS